MSWIGTIHCSSWHESGCGRIEFADGGGPSSLRVPNLHSDVLSLDFGTMHELFGDFGVFFSPIFNDTSVLAVR